MLKAKLPTEILGTIMTFLALIPVPSEIEFLDHAINREAPLEDSDGDLAELLD